MRTAAALALALAAGAGLAACSSSSSSSSASAASLQGSTRQQDCTAVTDALANGPDPDADSVGYAEAQILPLQQLTLTDSAVHAAVAKLDAAYKAFADGSASAQTQNAVAVSSAESALNQLCPGAAP